MTTPRPRLIAAHDAAATFYRRELQNDTAQGPRDYLRHRGFASVTTSPIWTIGYAPSGWTALTGHLRTEGFTDQELLDAGLVIATRRGTIVDRFRDRLMFGLRDTTGDLVGFTGRAAPGVTDERPKYLNTPHTSIYDKGALLFGLTEQRARLTPQSIPVLVEGPMDALALATCLPPTSPHVGIAVCGAGVTEAQVRALAAVGANTVIVAFDADDAGRRASLRALPSLQPTFTHVRAVTLAGGQDPASLTGRRHQLADALDRCHPLADDLVDDVLRHYNAKLDNAEARVCALRDAAQTVASLPPADVGRQVVRISNRLDFPVRDVTRELADAVTSAPGQPHHIDLKRARPSVEATRSRPSLMR